MRKKLHLIAGTMCNEKLWVELSPYLNSSLELVYLDIPRGKSFDELAEYYNYLLGSEGVHLIGFSLGAYIAAYFSTLFPERIEKLFLISSSPTRLSVDELNQRRDVLKFVKAHGYKGLGRKKAASLLDPTNQTDYLIDLILEMDRDLGENEFISQYQYTSERTDLSEPLRRLPLHTHFYFSDNDRLVNSQWISELKDLSPKVSIIRTSGSGHMLPLEKPRELAKYINSWVEL